MPYGDVHSRWKVGCGMWQGECGVLYDDVQGWGREGGVVCHMMMLGVGTGVWGGECGDGMWCALFSAFFGDKIINTGASLLLAMEIILLNV